jgi:DeoR family transcriptional regulator of aga operon
MRVPDLAEYFGVSTVTIRSDLDFLAGRGYVVRVRGGVIPSSLFSERPFEARQGVAAREKEAIAAAAVGLLKSDDTLILDVGTTTTAICYELLAHPELENLAVFTNGLTIALALRPAIPRIEVMVTGGTLRPRENALVEPGGTGFTGIRAHYAFVGCEGIHPEQGISTANLPEVSMKQAMLRGARQRVVVADSSKFMKEGLATVCGLDDVDLILTAGPLGPGALARFSEFKAEIRVAEPPGTEVMRVAPPVTVSDPHLPPDGS